MTKMLMTAAIVLFTSAAALAQSSSADPNPPPQVSAGHGRTAQASRRGHRGYNTRAQAPSPEEGMMTPDREKALRECSEQANKLVQKDWGVMQLEKMDSCMAQHGQPG